MGDRGGDVCIVIFGRHAFFWAQKRPKHPLTEALLVFIQKIEKFEL